MIGTGNITLHLAGDDSVVETFDVASSPQLTVGATSITIDPSNLLLGNTEYYVLIDGTAVDDIAGNDFPGISVTTDWSFTVDSIAPGLVSLDPTDDATGVGPAANLTITLDDTIAPGTGNITLHLTSDNSVVETFDVTSSPRLTFGATSVTIDPTNLLVGGTEYYVLIPGTAITDLAGNGYAGISATTDWSFSVEGVPPTVTFLCPEDDTSTVFPDSVFTLVFDEDVQVGTGNIEIRLASDDSVVETFDVTSDVTVFDAQVAFLPSSPLSADTDFYINVDTGAIEDLAGNDFAGISGTTAWSFSTVSTTTIVSEEFSLVTESGEEVSNLEVKDRLRQLIDSEDKQHPLSDQKLMDLLHEAGYPLARRTVAKYREQMGIPVARLRKEL